MNGSLLILNMRKRWFRYLLNLDGLTGIECLQLWGSFERTRPILDEFLDVILDLLLDLIKLLEFLRVMRVELIRRLPLQGLSNDLLSSGPILLTRIQLLKRANRDASVILILTKDILLLDDLIIIYEIIIDVVVVKIRIPFFWFFADGAWTLDVTLLHDLLVELGCDVVEFCLLLLLGLVGSIVEGLEVSQMCVVEGYEIVEVTDLFDPVIVHSKHRLRGYLTKEGWG